jgi:hypothetical protein
MFDKVFRIEPGPFFRLHLFGKSYLLYKFVVKFDAKIKITGFINQSMIKLGQLQKFMKNENDSEVLIYQE